LITVVSRRRALAFERWSSLTSGSFRNRYSNRCTNSIGFAWLYRLDEMEERFFSLRISRQVVFPGQEKLGKCCKKSITVDLGWGVASAEISRWD
jgi:hypothetical protein